MDIGKSLPLSGSLIMDSHMAGQLYVKGIWVNDFSKEGLHAGADMTSLRLDRDRRAIVHRSDIEHQVSDVIHGGV